MAKFNLDNYETVEDRLKVFWKDNPNARISTEIAHITPEGTCVTIRAEIYKQEEDARPVSTGIAQETKGQGGFANADAWMENCETSAIGRALANWKYQGSGKARPSKEEMSKVGNSKDNVGKQETPKKKQVAQEITKSPSSITESQLKEMVFSMCNEDKNFAKKCYDTSITRLKMDKTISDNVAEWSNDNVDKFLLLVESYVTKFKQDFEDRAGNTEVVNNIIETLGNVKEKESEEDMADIPDGPWQQEPISDGQKNFINTLITQCIDAGLDELGAEAKAYLNGGEATKGNASAMIDKLKSALS
tara:strand:+ start:5161 stop:6072 length:912 start_codon:yes stop_codon:yes gene_type:complete